MTGLMTSFSLSHYELVLVSRFDSNSFEDEPLRQSSMDRYSRLRELPQSSLL